MNTATQIIVWRRIALYLRSGISLPRALAACTRDVSDKKTKLILERLEESISQGMSLSNSCALFPKIFTSFTISYLLAGESSGTLRFSCERLALLLERKRALTRQIIQSSIYPLLIGFGTIAITVFLTVFVFPRILPILQGFHTRLPLPTRILLYTTTFINTEWIYVLGGTAIAITLASASLYVARARQLYEYLLLRLPLVGKILKLYILATFFLMVGALLKSGIRFVLACEMTEATLPGKTYTSAISTIRERIASGERSSLAFAEFPTLFPSPTTSLIDAGETTGTLRESFEYLGQHFETQLDDVTKQLTTLIEPFLMIAMGFGVGFIALAIITPMYSITQSVTAP